MRLLFLILLTFSNTLAMKKNLMNYLLAGGILASILYSSIASAQLASNMREISEPRQFFIAGTDIGQSFKVPMDASFINAISVSIDREIIGASLYIYGSENNDGYNLSRGNPDYIQTEINIIESPEDFGFMQRIELATPFPVEAGKTYRFYISRPNIGGIGALMTHNNKYEDGVLLHDFFPLDSRPDFDIAFQVWGVKSNIINFDNNTPSEVNVNETLVPVAIASSGLPVTISISTESSNICRITGNIVSFNAPGTCLLLADQAGNEEYLAANQASHSITVNNESMITQSISFILPPPSYAVIGDSYYPSATATSGLPVRFTIATASVNICSISNSEVMFNDLGICTVLADQEGDSTYLPATQIEQSFAITSLPGPVDMIKPVPTLSNYLIIVISALTGIIGFLITRTQRKKPI